MRAAERATPSPPRPREAAPAFLRGRKRPSGPRGGEAGLKPANGAAGAFGEAGPLPEGAAERSEAGGVSRAEFAESESHAENAETAEP